MFVCFLERHQDTYFFEEVGHLELVLLRGNVGLDLGVGVVDDGEEHVEQDEEDEEDVEHEVGGAEHAVRLLQLVVVEVAQNDAEQRKPGKSITQSWLMVGRIIKQIG